jgi:hypothetical protein
MRLNENNGVSNEGGSKSRKKLSKNVPAYVGQTEKGSVK